MPLCIVCLKRKCEFFIVTYIVWLSHAKNYRSWNHASRSGNDLYDNDILHISSPISSLSLSLFTNYARVCQIFWKLYVTEKVFLFVCCLIVTKRQIGIAYTPKTSFFFRFYPIFMSSFENRKIHKKHQVFIGQNEWQ